MIDVLLPVVAGIVISGICPILLFRTNIHKREEIMLSITMFSRRVGALRSALETDKLYHTKDRDVISAVNLLEEDFLSLYAAMRWPWYPVKRREELFRTFYVFKSSFDAFSWVDCDQAAQENRAKSEELARMLSSLLILLR